MSAAFVAIRRTLFKFVFIVVHLILVFVKVFRFFRQRRSNDCDDNRSVTEEVNGMQKMPAYSRSNDLWPNPMNRKRKRDEQESEMISWFRFFKHKVFGKDRNEEASKKQPRISDGDCIHHQTSTKRLTSTPKQKRGSSHSWFKLKDKQKFSELIQKHLIDEPNAPQTQSSTQTDLEHTVIELASEATAIEKTLIENEDEKKLLREKCEKGAVKESDVASTSRQSIGDSQVIPESVKKVKELFASKSKFFEDDWLSNLKAGIDGDRKQGSKASEEHEESLTKVKEETRQQKDNLNKVLRKRLNDKELSVSLYSLYISKAEEEEETDVVEITDEMNELIEDSLHNGSPDDIIVENLKRADFRTLLGLNWLNDEIINGYFTLLEKEFNDVKCLNTFFYARLKKGGFQAVKRWTKKFDLFSYSLVLIPLHLQVHWTLISISMENKEIHYYDSMSNDSMSGQKHLETILSYLKDEKKDKKGEQLNTNEWKLIEETDIPLQLNGSDCGMFCCKYAYYLSKRKRFSFHQSLMPYFRRRMIYELITQKLL